MGTLKEFLNGTGSPPLTRFFGPEESVIKKNRVKKEYFSTKTGKWDFFKMGEFSEGEFWWILLVNSLFCPPEFFSFGEFLWTFLG